jgi:type I restriction enzyme S subunit
MSEVRRGYKQTEVGVIPEDWDVRPLGTISTYVNGKAHEADINESGKYVVVNSKFISTNGKTKKYSDKCLCPAQKGEVLMVMSDVPNGRAIARCYLVECDDVYTVNQRICDISPNGIDGRLLFFVLDRNSYYLSFDDGVKQTNLRKEDVLSCLLSLPPTRAEQEAIAEALSDADALIESLEHLLTKKRQIKQGAMQDLLTGKKRLPGFDEKWDISNLGNLLTICHGKSQRGIEQPNGPYPILATGGEIGRAYQFLCDTPSVLIGRKGTIDRPRYMDTPFWSVDTLFYSIVHPPNCAKFLYYSFCLIDWKQYNEASGVPSLNAKTVEEIEVSLPEAAEQTAIATVLSDMDADITALENKLTKARQLKQGMMQNLLTGKIRLV